LIVWLPHLYGNDRSVCPIIVRAASTTPTRLQRFPISLMRTIGKTQRAILVGPSNFPLFGPRGKHRGFEDCLVIDLGLRNLQFRVMSLHIVSRLDSLAFQSKAPSKGQHLRYDLTTLHTWIIC
jgi:hypothetical protein